MTIGFRSILVVNSEKNDNLFWKCKFFGYVCFTGKSENLAETAILNDFFYFCSKWSPFSKMLVFKGNIKYLLFLKSVNFWWHCFLLVKITFYAKSVRFWANEWISKYSDKIMSCKLWGKVTSVSVNINFGGKMSILWKKKLKFWEKYWLFHQVGTTTESDHLFAKVWFFHYMCFTGKSENLAKTPILKDFFIFVAMVTIFKNVSF